jgi:hypothetical protein
MQPGDVIQVRFSAGGKPQVLFFDAEGQLTVSLFEDWKAGQQAQEVTQSAQAPNVELAYGTMPVFTISQTTEWQLAEGVETVEVPGGRGLKLGPRSTEWRVKTHAVVPVADEFPPKVTQAAVAKIGEGFAFVTSDEVAKGHFAVRVDTASYSKRGVTSAHKVKGDPHLLAKGHMRHGTTNVTDHSDELWMVAEGDVLRIGHYRWDDQFFPGGKALFVENGQIQLTSFASWLLHDAQTNPGEYIGKGWVPVEHVPAEWLGSVVETFKSNGEQPSYNTYAIKAIEPKLLLNSGWDNNPPVDWTSEVRDEVAWLKLRPELVAEEAWQVKEVRTFIQVNGWPIPAGERRVAAVTTIRSKKQWSDGTHVWEYEFRFEADAQEIEATTYVRSGMEETKERVLRELRVPHTIKVEAYLESGRNGEIYGDLMIHASEYNRSIRWHIDDRHVTNEDLAAVQGQVEAVKVAANNLLGEIKKRGGAQARFTHEDTLYLLDRPLYIDQEASVYHKMVYRGFEVNVVDLFMQGILQAWATSLGTEAKEWRCKSVASSAAVEAAESNDPTMDFEINLGKNRGRQESKVWIISKDGQLLDTREGAKTATFTNVPTTALVLRHQWSNLGYTHTEVFEVWCLPEELTEAQLAAATTLAVEFERTYFTGKIVTWDISKPGQRIFKTPYRQQLDIDATPVAIDEGFVVQRLPRDPEALEWEDPDHPVLVTYEISKA